MARSSATDSGSPLIDVTPVSSTQGLLTVTATATVSEVTLELFPAATATLAPGTYSHALWMRPSTPSAYAWWTGNLIIEGASQP